jgi:hypothetical protein
MAFVSLGVKVDRHEIVLPGDVEIANVLLFVLAFPLALTGLSGNVVIALPEQSAVP